MSRVLRILLVEDEDPDAELVLRQIRKAGFEAEWSRVDCAAEYARQLHPELDVILSDFNLPQFSAPEALQMLNESGFDIPFIIISGTIGEETAVAAMRNGATDYLLKDRLGRLGQAIEQALDKRQNGRLRARAEAELKASQERFRLLADTIAEVFWVTNADQTELQYVSPGFEKIWGIPCPEAYANPQAWLEATHPDDRGKVQKAVRSACTGEEPTFDVEYRILRPDGALRWVHDRAFPVLDEQGEITKMVGVARDVTERKQLEAEYRQAQKMEALGQLSAGIAHDFNNLLMVIKGYTTLLALPGIEEQELQECASEIESAVDSAVGLTNQLLLFSRKNVIRRSLLNLEEVVTKMGRLLERSVGSNITFRFERDDQAPQVEADAGMLEQVLLNLVLNARDAMPDGGCLTVGTSLVEQNGVDGQAFACLRVTDNGHGIPPEHQSRLFEPFFTTKAAGKGTGLGLATVFGIVQQHQGKIEVESAPGQGTTFCILLPATVRVPEARVEEASSRPGDSARGEETILVVEDEKRLRSLLVRLLSRTGYRILEAESGTAALEVWDAHKDEIRLLLTDMVMPDGVSGLELANRLKGERPDLQVILTSGISAELATRGKSVDDTFSFLQKPYDFSELAEQVRVSLSERCQTELGRSL